MQIASLPLALLALSPPLAALQLLSAPKPKGLHDLFGRVLLAAEQGATGNELWSASSTAAQLVVDVNPGPAHAFHSGDPEWLVGVPLKGAVMGADLYFFAYLANDKIGLGRSDGTAAGTNVLYQFEQLGSTWLYGYAFEGVGLADRLVVGARTNATGWGAWSTDGTTGGTKLLVTGMSQPRGFTRVGNEALFFVHGSPTRIWRTDGTPAGTRVEYSFPPGAIVDVGSLAVMDGAVFFVAGDAATGRELWKTDGTAAGTGLVLDVSPGPADSYPRELVRVGDAVYFSAQVGASRDLWRSDGTAAGTTLAVEVQWGYDEGPRHLTALGDRLFFAHGVSGSDDNLYVYEHPNLDLLRSFTGTGGLPPGVSEIRAVGSRRVFLQGNDGVHGVELWVSDGTPAGTQLFEDVQPGAGWANPHEFLLSDGLLFFVANAWPGVETLQVRSIGATAQPIGVGCAASGLLPRLDAEDPVIGGASRLFLEGAEPSAAVFVFVGSPAAPWSLGAGCYGHLDPAGLVTLTTALTDGEGAWTSPSFPLPSEPALSGVQLTLQAVVGPTATPPLGFDVSNGVLFTLGS